MPQKRNPVALEHARAIGSKALGQAQAIVTSRPQHAVRRHRRHRGRSAAARVLDVPRRDARGEARRGGDDDGGVRRRAARGPRRRRLDDADRAGRHAGPRPRAAVPSRARDRGAAGRRPRSADPEPAARRAPRRRVARQSSARRFSTPRRRSRRILSPRHFVDVRKTLGGPAPAETARAARGVAAAARRGRRRGGRRPAGRARRRATERADTPDRARPCDRTERYWRSRERVPDVAVQAARVVISRSWSFGRARHRPRLGSSRADPEPIMHALDWVVVVAYLVWIVVDGLRRSKGTDKVDGYFLANRSLPWWAVGLSVMATQMSAITLVGTTGQAYPTGLRFVQFYFGLPLAMIILSLTVVPFFTARGSTPRTSTSSGASTCATRSLASFLFLMGRAFSLGVTLAAPAVVMSAILGWTLPVTVLAICVPMIVYTMLGGVQAVAWTDVKQMFIVVGGMSAAVGDPALRHPAARQLRPGAAPRRRDRPAAGHRLHVRPARDLHVLVGDDRRAVPDAVVLRLRSEPGAALPDGEVDRRGAAVAADERLRQDSAAAADPRRPACSCSSSTCFRRRRCCSTARTTRRSRRARRRREYAALQQEFDARDRRAPRRGRRATTATAFLASDARVRDIRAQRRRRRASRRPATSATTTSTTCSRRSSRRAMPIGLVGLMIAAIFAAAMSASGGELNALSTATVIDFYRRHFVTEADRRALPARCRSSRRSSGACSPASSRCTRRTRDRSSRSSTGTGRSSTARCSACSSSRF